MSEIKYRPGATDLERNVINAMHECMSDPKRMQPLRASGILVELQKAEKEVLKQHGLFPYRTGPQKVWGCDADILDEVLQTPGYAEALIDELMQYDTAQHAVLAAFQQSPQIGEYWTTSTFQRLSRSGGYANSVANLIELRMVLRHPTP